MGIASLINRPCTIVQRDESGTTDAYGTEQKVVTLVDTVCELQQRQRDEPGQQGELSVTLWALFFLPDVSLNSGDAVIVDGETYELVGEPWRARNPRTQVVEHIEATARRTAGTSDEVGS